MAIVAVTASNGGNAKNYVDRLESRGATVRLLTPERFASPEEAMDGVSGLILTGGGDVDPARYGQDSNGSMACSRSATRWSSRCSTTRRAGICPR